MSVNNSINVSYLVDFLNRLDEKVENGEIQLGPMSDDLESLIGMINNNGLQMDDDYYKQFEGIVII